MACEIKREVGHQHWTQAHKKMDQMPSPRDRRERERERERERGGWWDFLHSESHHVSIYSAHQHKKREGRGILHFFARAVFSQVAALGLKVTRGVEKSRKSKWRLVVSLSQCMFLTWFGSLLLSHNLPPILSHCFHLLFPLPCALSFHCSLGLCCSLSLSDPPSCSFSSTHGPCTKGT